MTVLKYMCHIEIVNFFHAHSMDLSYRSIAPCTIIGYFALAQAQDLALAQALDLGLAHAKD